MRLGVLLHIQLHLQDGDEPAGQAGMEGIDGDLVACNLERLSHTMVGLVDHFEEVLCHKLEEV